MSDIINKGEFSIFVSEGKRGAGTKETERGAEWTEQPEYDRHKGWYQGLLLEKEGDRVFLSNLTENEFSPGETGLAVVADERFSVYYVDSNGSQIKILGQRQVQQLDSGVFLRPQPDRRAPLIFRSQTVVNLVIAERNQNLKLVQITKV